MTADSSIFRPSGVAFLNAPSQLSTTRIDFCLACFRRTIFEKTLTVSQPRRSWNSSFQLAYDDLPDIESITSSIQGNCMRSLTGDTQLDAWTLRESATPFSISKARVVYPVPGAAWMTMT